MKKLILVLTVVLAVAIAGSAFAYTTSAKLDNSAKIQKAIDAHQAVLNKLNAERAKNAALTTNRAAEKAPYSGPVNKPDHGVILQGGDTIEDAFPITSLPFTDDGTTVGYTDDYEEACPYSSTSPDVVYSYAPTEDGLIDITLCVGTTDYDTKVFVYENAVGNLVGCNDDACSSPNYSNYVSEILGLAVTAGNTYYIVVDGYGGGSGNYTLDVSTAEECIVDCPAGGIQEGEPDCGDEYVDNYNGGCNSDPAVFQAVNIGDTICGTSGTFLFSGYNYRDTDWFEVEVTDTGTLSFGAVGEFPILIFIIDSGSGDCSDYSVLTSGSAAPCDTVNISYDVSPGTYWLWVGPSVFDGAPCPANYVAWSSFEQTGPPPCDPDVVIGDLTLPYQYLGGTTCGYGNDNENTCLGYYDGGEDILFQFDVTSEVTVNITMDPYETTWTGLLIDDNCPPDEDCIAYSTGSSGIREIDNLTLAPGTYYIMIDTWPSPDCIPEFDLTIEESGEAPQGDNCDDPFIVDAIPFNDSGNSCDFNDDCDITGSNGKDVIYQMVITDPIDLDISLCNSDYDTKLAVFADECCTGPGTELYYNDDNCGLQSEIIGSFEPGTYYVVVDGYGSACGNYVLDISEYTPPTVECPEEGIPEGEPDCGPDYVDEYNGGCNSDPAVFQSVQNGDIICGTSGTFLYSDLNYRDTDWFEVEAGDTGDITLTGVAEFPLLMFIIDSGSGDCSDYTILASGTADAGDTLTLTYTVDAGTYWLWVGPSVFDGVDCGSDYVIWVTAPVSSGPDISIGMEPFNSPVVVHRNDDFFYYGSLTNNTDSDLTTDVWINILMPDGSMLDPLRQWNDILVSAGAADTYVVRQHVPGNAPFGDYLYIAYDGDYPNIMDSTYFELTVVSGGTAKSGSNEWTVSGWGEKIDAGTIPTEFALKGSYPNPFNAQTSISFDVPTASKVSLEVYNIMGQKVATLVNGNIEAGSHTVIWDAGNYSSGIYFYKLNAGNKIFTKRMTLLK